MSSEAYRVQENTGNPAHPSIEDVITLALDRAAGPRPSNHQDRHFDEYVRDAVEHAGEAAVKQAIRLSLTEGYTPSNGWSRGIRPR